MKDVLLAVMMLAVFAFGFFVTGRFGRFMDKYYQGRQKPKEPGGKVFITKTGGKSAREISEEVGTALESLPDREDYEIIIRKRPDSHR